MSLSTSPSSRFVIACGGTGGHLFPGLAVANKLVERGCEVTLLISPKDVDQQAVKCATLMEVVTLPAVGLRRRNELSFVHGFTRSYRLARKLFRRLKPQAALAMGGFTSAAPILAAKASGTKTFLHESNSIPGRANRWLSWIVDRGFISFPSASSRLKRCPLSVSGTPVRPEFRVRDAASCREELGLEPERPVMLVMGGSQGARGVNELVGSALPLLAKTAPEWQWIHLTGAEDASRMQKAYAALNFKALVYPFFDRMEYALGAASAAVTRAGASTLAELAVMRLPAVLVPYPAATDNHQWHNAHAYATSGAARLMPQTEATPEEVTRSLLDLVRNEALRQSMQSALAQWHCPAAGDEIADDMLAAVGVTEPRRPLPRSINLRPIPLTTNPGPATASAEAVAEPAFARELPRPEPASV
jgi:UDP-N-acetylglucosamine--N-acetylmuramyl-(pentapeptide) pyrophosphoryl-undecaprenol N-acetylglucosamine transferase